MKEREPWRASPDKSSDSPARVRPPAKQKTEPANQRSLGLQQAVGNQEVMRLLQSNAIQAKLHVSQPGDPDEIEADRVADRVVSAAPPATVHRKCSCPGGTASCPACEEEEVEKAKGIHRKANQTSNGNLAVRDDLLGSLGPGDPLDPATQASMESHFGADFSGVRVHADEPAAQSARSINAHAYTVDRDIVFDAGAYAPHSPEGKRLLAHELTHVVQQSGGRTGTARAGSQLSTVNPRKVQRDAADIISAGTNLVLGSGLGSLFNDPQHRQMTNDLVHSVTEAPQHAGEILVGEVWDAIKEHWASFLAVTMGMVAAEITIGFLAGLPEPTLLSKVVAIILQGLVLAILGYFAAVELKAAYDEGGKWLSLGMSANGDPKTVSEASRSFVRMIRSIILAILALIGARAKVGGIRSAVADIGGKTPAIEGPPGQQVPKVEQKPPATETKPSTPEQKPPGAADTAPSPPAGWSGTPNEFGKEIEWPGQGKIKTPAENVDLAKLRRAGVTEKWATEQAKIYRDIAKANPRNPSATLRAEWLEKIAGRLRNEP
jgi:hypothetical protein